MSRTLLSALTLLAALAAASVAFAAWPPTPPCPQVEGWSFTRALGPIDTGGGVDYGCEYAQSGRSELLTLNVVWLKPTVRDTDADYSQCTRATTTSPFERFVWSRAAFARVYEVVNGGSTAGNAAVFQANRERIEKAGLVLLEATEKLAKPCAKTPVSKPSPTTRPVVRVSRATGIAGAAVSFPFSVSAAGKVRIRLTIHGAPNKAKVLFRKDYGLANPGRYSPKIRVASAATNLWCITATDAAGNTATACNALVVRR